MPKGKDVIKGFREATVAAHVPGVVELSQVWSYFLSLCTLQRTENKTLTSSHAAQLLVKTVVMSRLD